MIEVASLRYGVICKKAFSRSSIFQAFVKDFLGLDLEIDQVETEKSFSPIIGAVDSDFDLFAEGQKNPIIGAVDSRFDLFAEDPKNRIIVDIQHAGFIDHYDRFLHDHCVALLEQRARAQNYPRSQDVFTIVILIAGDAHYTDLATIDFDPKSRTGQPLGKILHKIFYVCPKYVTDDTPEPYREWLLAIQDSLDQQVDETAYHQPAIQEMFRVIEKDTITPQERARMKDEYAYNEWWREQSQAYIEQSRQEGQQEGESKLLRRFGPPARPPGRGNWTPPPRRRLRSGCSPGPLRARRTGFPAQRRAHQTLLLARRRHPHQLRSLVSSTTAGFSWRTNGKRRVLHHQAGVTGALPMPLGGQDWHL